MSVHLTEERRDLPELLLEHADARLRRSLEGARVTHYSVGEEELLWLSSSATFRRGAFDRRMAGRGRKALHPGPEDSPGHERMFGQAGRFVVTDEPTRSTVAETTVRRHNACAMLGRDALHRHPAG